MTCCKQKSLILWLVLFVSIFADTESGNSRITRPWMFFVTSVWPPSGPDHAKAFSKACYIKLKKYLDTTSYQIILLQSNQTPEKLSNRKKDLILSTDKADYLVRGTEYDTLVLWLRYRVGFSHSRITVPYKRGQSGPLPELVAQYVFSTATSEFLGFLSLRGGPPGVSMKISDDFTVIPPCRFYLPPGIHAVTTSFTNFKTRTDSIEIFPGRALSKRILLLPIE